MNLIARVGVLVASLMLAVAVAPAVAKPSGGGHSPHTSSGSKDHAVSGYTKKDGTQVAPSHATNPNKDKRDNYSSRGNTNPYTGKEGTKDPNKPGK